jgi:hypothetical protein
MAANPVYDTNGEIPVTARGTGIQTIDGFLTRTPFESQLDLQAAYALHMAGSRRLTFMADFFNLFNNRQVTGYDQNTELGSGTPNLDYCPARLRSTWLRSACESARGSSSRRS